MLPAASLPKPSADSTARPGWSSVLKRRFAPPPRDQSIPRLERDLPLEGLRGLCALAVFYAHLFLPLAALDPRWAPPAGFFWFDLGVAAVLMFFVLSGYVIGLVTRTPADGPATHRYCRNRLARIGPLNTIAVLLSWLLLPSSDPHTVVGNLFLLQNDLPYPGLGSIPPLVNNGNLWSLHYEAVYYLAFVAVWWFAPSGAVLFGGLALVVIAFSLGAPVSGIIARHACGGFYWFAGLAIAWWTEPSDEARQGTEWPAAALAFFAMWTAGPLRTLLYDFQLTGWLWPKVTSPHRLDFLLVCLWGLLAVIARAPRFRRALAQSCFALLIATLLCRALRGRWEDIDWATAAATLLAIVLHRRAFSLAALRRLAPVGAISFGLYIIAAPLQLAQREVAPEFSGSAFTYTVRALVYAVLAFALAWLLEKRLAPPLSRWLRRERGALPTQS